MMWGAVRAPGAGPLPTPALVVPALAAAPVAAAATLPYERSTSLRRRLMYFLAIPSGYFSSSAVMASMLQRRRLSCATAL